MRQEDNSLEKAQVALATEWTTERKDLVRRMYAPQCSEDEFAVFLGMAQKLGLDPSCGEIYAVKYGSRPASIFIGKNGYLAYAQRHPKYDGHKVEAIMDEKGDCIGARATVWRKDRSHPVVVEVDMDEYSTGKSLWSKPSQGGKPKTMIKKVALSQCLRESFDGLGGTYDESETWEDRTVDAKVMPVPTEGPPVTEDEKKASMAQAFMQQAEKEGWLAYVPEEDISRISKMTRKQLQAMADSARELMAADAAEEHEETIMSMALESEAE